MFASERETGWLAVVAKRINIESDGEKIKLVAITAF